MLSLLNLFVMPGTSSVSGGKKGFVCVFYCSEIIREYDHDDEEDNLAVSLRILTFLLFGAEEMILMQV